MDFLKKHYEKIILSTVLLGLVGALVVLPVMITHDQEEIKKMGDEYIAPKATPLPPLNLAEQEATILRVQSPATFDFSTTNKVFNPVEWKKTADGNLIKIKSGNEIGAGAADVTKITPLYFVLSLVSVQTNEFGARYVIGVERQSASNPALRRPQQRYASVGEKKDFFTLLEVKGDPADPSEVTLKLPDTGEIVKISKDKPFRRADDYAADLKYPLEDKSFPDRRVGSMMTFGGENYIVVAVNADQVILSAQSNQKKTTLRYTP